MWGYGDEKSPKEIMILLSKRTRVLRKQEKMSQKELSERSGVSYASVRKFESTGVISLESLLKICEALKRLTDFESILLPSDMKRKKELFNY
ncbi:helix-turn-helix transcriptional regulator [Tenacibaculum sp. AHE15PA]|uniref:helix-turn-helix domain-containing protein n=1 Tax=Tenacibaculum TaxID=104267 RepID=UPI001C4EDDB7|nr:MULTISPECIES: helix-turn-helix transcriptional regulator [Tenacibaculum]QXP73152.1 helix-turn-helix transcriptional regulator [Tenacibaculum sp. AHE14PA]QXP77065.1 helix-turn-helix transcriptional regulator [Tenacibaculum sp. AHE15PA]